ncbi:hypothetical protein B0H21DRAFT_659818, partial [Amylocystis lapponica]
LRRWLSRPDCPPALRECKVLFDKVFHGADTPVEDEAIMSAVTLAARLKHRGVIFTRHSTHVGNSLVFFYPEGDRTRRRPVPGSIKYVFDGKFAVQRQIPVYDGTTDPFRHYPGFPAKLYSADLSTTLEVVEVEWVTGHYARWLMPSGKVVVLSLSRVSVFS